MHDLSWMHQALLLLAAVVVAVPIFTRLKLGAVLAYLVAGALLGPTALALVEHSEQQAQVAELGVVLLMFLVGLELSPARLWLMRRAVFGMGAAQFVLTTLVLSILALLAGFDWKTALVAGGALSLSSTAIGVQLLAERKQIGDPHGRNSLGILLFQDLAAIPALAVIPLLGAAAGPDAGFSWLGFGKAIASVAAVVVFGRYLVRPLFRIAAQSKSVEVFSAATLFVALGTAWITGLAGLSMALGAFLAGILLADSEYRHEVESHLEPFKGLLLGLFFLSVGMSVDWLLVLANWLQVLLGVVLLVLVKGAILVLLGRLLARMAKRDSLRMAAYISQGGEFAFVLLALAAQTGVMPASERDLLSASIVLSMAVTPILVILVERWTVHLDATQSRQYDEVPEHEHPRVVIAGFGRVGQIVGRVLRASRIPFLALEQSVEQVELSRRFGSLIYYGDPSRPETLRAARLEHAEVFVLAMDNPDESVRIAKLVKRLYPHVKILARARNRRHVFGLWEAEVDVVTRETFHSSLKMARRTLSLLGMDEDRAGLRVERFRQHDESILKAQFQMRNDEAQMIQSTREALVELQQIFEADEVDQAESDVVASRSTM
ncbi:glutathione-regulated potassium-efflux system protein KefB [Ahniella affigens]|uniref:Glutathione-regulated potassium-efflux system protein KefB n=1 Tax=Ahniella affigens TaxID=2021234 RepID=A0A2P1PMA9_9GAMM|nr:monovalent cation:proton antiporter-2 (CPA2) family protein [Ahniella affigens]AVP95983.1 glutathione-regulated potassium-efflux system protein KefB [Ahniella affigens]